MSHSASIASIRAISNTLGDISKQGGAGGATVSLYADRAAVEVRPADDIDMPILIQLSTWEEKNPGCLQNAWINRSVE
jgi:hypothetical protein